MLWVCVGCPSVDLLSISRGGRVAPNDSLRRTDHPREQARYPRLPSKRSRTRPGQSRARAFLSACGGNCASSPPSPVALQIWRAPHPPSATRTS
eukprot:3382924-Pleurochrysis_carterae.AAC.1